MVKPVYISHCKAMLYLTIIEPIYQYDISLHNYIMALKNIFFIRYQEVISRRKSANNIKYNGKKKKYKQRSTKLKINQHESH
jgi:hypothetical protein